MDNLFFCKRVTSQKIIFWLSIILTLLCLVYFIRGYYYLIVDKQLGAGDLYSRWKEQQYIYRGLYPYDITEGSPFIDSQLGPVMSGGYPPWAFFSGLIFFPPISFEVTRWYHAFLNSISLVILAIFAYQIGKPHGKLKAWFIVSACLSIASHSTTLSAGQYGIIINALLIGMFWLLQKGHNLSSGLLLGLALLKPNISALYFLILFIKKRINAVLACCLYIIISSSIIGIFIQVSPIYMIEKMIKVSKYYVNTGYSGINVLTNLGINPATATILLAVVASAIVLGLLYLFKDHSLLFLFAIASVIGRLWTYHLAYDNVMLIFLLLAVINLTFNNLTKLNISILTFLLLTLLIPSGMTNLAYVQIAQSIIWVSALIYLLICQKEFKEVVTTN
ncbi:glycosyltransferase 87 family protein [Nodularia harveyana UHCC-0300]|uniref:Glycosyltransferase 87 family protein n=1 Tax=Nodularia harveyana UHCC-0300 TaxID=2974287 RepID=A0ABU5UJE5_9CYAN|nr:glycosyltransferase 87 family protein [Nodularia harveyana]MEA5583200.1 glycosyltransferase 87 family protein [Nodularia harveyana UHCC-0300]